MRFPFLAVLSVLPLLANAVPAVAQPGPFADPRQCYEVCGPSGCYRVCPSQQFGAPLNFGGQFAGYPAVRSFRDGDDVEDVRFRFRFRERVNPFSLRGEFGVSPYGPYTPGRCPGGCPNCPTVRVPLGFYR